jgi:hypothetical protein
MTGGWHWLVLALTLLSISQTEGGKLLRTNDGKSYQDILAVEAARYTGGRSAVDDLLACAAPTVGVDSAGSDSQAAFVDQARYPFCHVFAAGEVALYWTHDSLQHGKLNDIRQRV